MTPPEENPSSEEASRRAATDHMETTRGKLRAARVLLLEGEAGDSMSRAYYAIFHAAQGALALLGEAPKTHRGTQTRFWTCLVKTGQFPEALARLISYAKDLQLQADYETATGFDDAAAADLLKDAARFVDETDALIRRLEEEGAE